jgi:phage terminase large subunit
MGVVDSLALVRARLAPADGNGPRLFVHRRCEKLIESLERYHYPEDDPESDSPVKRDGFDHAVDALRYMIQNLDKPHKTGVRGYL